MAKLESAAQFNALVDEGKYESKTNAQRAAGRTRLSESEKKKAFAHIEAYFGADGPTAPAPKPGKKAAKKAAKKKAKKKASAAAVVPVTAAEAAPTEAPPAAAKPGKKAKKKAAGKKKVTARVEKAPPGTLPISPAQVQTTGDLLTLIDSTVTKSVSIIEALQRADELSKVGDISKGVSLVKEALTNAAQLMQNAVVTPLRHVGNQADPEVNTRLEQVVASAHDPLAQLPSYTLPPDQQAQMAQQQPPLS